jgi:hypothetical protein
MDAFDSQLSGEELSSLASPGEDQQAYLVKTLNYALLRPERFKGILVDLAENYFSQTGHRVHSMQHRGGLSLDYARDLVVITQSSTPLREDALETFEYRVLTGPEKGNVFLSTARPLWNFVALEE